MIDFTWWWAWLLLPIPLIIYWLLPVAQSGDLRALYLPFFSALLQSDSGRRRYTPYKVILCSCAWILLIASIARPIWLGELTPIAVVGRNIMLAVDISESMQQQDFWYSNRSITRLTAVKAVAGSFIEQRAQDRIGLVLFGSNAYLQTPLTFDVKTVNYFLQEAVSGLAGRTTAIGDAIGLSIKHLKHYEDEERVLVLLTDGSNNAGVLSPLEAAELAAQTGIRIYTIGVGPRPRQSLFSQSSGGIDEQTLHTIADTTDGRYFRAHDLNELSKIYSLIDQLEPSASEDESHRPVRELYFIPLLGFFFLLGWRQVWQ